MTGWSRVARLRLVCKIEAKRTSVLIAEGTTKTRPVPQTLFERVVQRTYFGRIDVLILARTRHTRRGRPVMVTWLNRRHPLSGEGLAMGRDAWRCAAMHSAGLVPFDVTTVPPSCLARQSHHSSRAAFV